MKNSLIAFSIFLVACSGTENQTTPTIEPVKKNCNACEICLLQDSLSKIDREKVTAFRDEARMEELDKIADELDKKVAALVIEFQKEAAYTEAQNELMNSDYAAEYNRPLSVAHRACKIEFPFDKIKDEKKREELFLNYSAYTDRLDMLIYPMIGEDTSEFRKENGNYLVLFQGEMLLVPLAEFNDYWSGVMSAYDNLVAHITAKRSESVEQLCGKKLDALSDVELLMLNAHANTYHHEFIKTHELLEKDEVLQKLETAMWFSYDPEKE